MPQEVVKECKVISTKRPCRGQKTIRPSHLTYDKQERFTLWTEQSPEDVAMKPADVKSITFRNCAIANFMAKVQKLRMLMSRMRQVHFKKLANINLAKNVPTNLMRNVLGFLQPSKRKYWKAFKQICKPLKIKKEDVPHS